MPKAGIVTISEIKDHRESFQSLVTEMMKTLEAHEVYALLSAWLENNIPGMEEKDE